MVRVIKALTLSLGILVLLVIAGLIEGFISPNEQIPWFVKWLVGLGSGGLLYSYLLLSGRPRHTRYKSGRFHKSVRPFNSR